jgi:hypothetical protein
MSRFPSHSQHASGSAIDTCCQNCSEFVAFAAPWHFLEQNLRPEALSKEG